MNAMDSHEPHHLAPHFNEAANQFSILVNVGRLRFTLLVAFVLFQLEQITPIEITFGIVTLEGFLERDLEISTNSMEFIRTCDAGRYVFVRVPYFRVRVLGRIYSVNLGEISRANHKMMSGWKRENCTNRTPLKSTIISTKVLVNGSINRAAAILELTLSFKITVLETLIDCFYEMVKATDDLFRGRQ